MQPVTDGQRIREIVAELNANDSEFNVIVELGNGSDMVALNIALLEADHAMDKRLARYKGTLSDTAFESLTIWLRSVLHANIRTKTEELRISQGRKSQ